MIFKGFLLQSKAYTVCPSVYHRFIRKPLKKMIIFLPLGSARAWALQACKNSDDDDDDDNL